MTKDIKISQIINIEDVPSEYLKIPIIYGHFSKFGKIIAIGINGQGSAEVIYESVDSATRALNSTEPFVDTRQISIIPSPSTISNRADLRYAVNYPKVMSEVAQVCETIDKAQMKSIMDRFNLHVTKK